MAALARDEAAFADRVADLLGARPGRLCGWTAAYTRRCFEPLFDSPFRITRSYAAQLVDALRDMGARALKLPRAEFFPLPPEMLFMNRLQFGFYSVLARLDVEVDYAAVERSFEHLIACESSA
jgi:hypothetical protein